MPEDTQTRRGFLDKTIRVKWMLILLGVVVLAGLGFWLAKARECGRIADKYETRLNASVSRSAENLATTIATVGNQAVVNRRWTDLQQYADKLVQRKPLTYIAITDDNGIARVHTNRAYLGKKYEQPQDTPDVIQASSPVTDQTRQVATVYIGMNQP